MRSNAIYPGPGSLVVSFLEQLWAYFMTLHLRRATDIPRSASATPSLPTEVKDNIRRGDSCGKGFFPPRFVSWSQHLVTSLIFCTEKSE
jgi:hypothetical protein